MDVMSIWNPFLSRIVHMALHPPPLIRIWSAYLTLFHYMPLPQLLEALFKIPWKSGFKLILVTSYHLQPKKIPRMFLCLELIWDMAGMQYFITGKWSGKLYVFVFIWLSCFEHRPGWKLFDFHSNKQPHDCILQL